MSFIDNKYFLLEKEPCSKRIVILPHAGGNASFYMKMGEMFAQFYEVIIIQYPGRLNRIREEKHSTIESYVNELKIILSKLSEKDTVIFGHSMGGLIAYEYAINSSLECHHVSKIIISSFNFLDKIKHRILHEAEALKILSLTDPDLMKQIQTDSTLHLLDMVLPPLINDLNAVATYNSSPLNINKELIVIFGDDDPTISIKHMESWTNTQKKEIEKIKFSGDHFYFKGAEEFVVKRIKEYL